MHENADSFNCGYSSHKCKTHSLFSPLIFSGANILGDKRRDRNGESSNKNKGKAFCTNGRPDAGNRSTAKRVDIALYQNVGEIDDTVLHGGRKSVLKNQAEVFTVRTEF